MAKYKKKPVIVEAEQFEYIESPPKGVFYDDFGGFYFVIPITGLRTPVKPSDWIILEPDDKHYYPCKDGIFQNTYDLVEEDKP